MKTTQNNSTLRNSRGQSVRKFFALMLFAVAGFSFAMAGPGSKAKNKLTKQIKNLIEYPESGNKVNLDGEAVIFFSLGDKDEIHVKGVFGTNEDLITHVENALEGQIIDGSGLNDNEEYQIRLKFNDLR